MDVLDEHDLTIKRTFDAPAVQVYECMTRPEYLRRWSSPDGFAIVQEQGEIHAGCKWRVCMRGPDGKDLWLGGMYRELVPGRHVVYTHKWDAPWSKETVVDITLREHDGKTDVVLIQDGFGTKADRDGHKEGWEQCFVKLAALLAKGPGEPA
jgi:uncharacterized protein YndB with AHSA1/START domain